MGLIQARGWANGPGMIWIPTAEGEAAYQALADGGEHTAFGAARSPANSGRD